MKLAKVRLPEGKIVVAEVEEDTAHILPLPTGNVHTLADILHSASPAATVKELRKTSTAVTKFQLLAPIDQQEVWAAGVTYKRSQVARMEESKSGASHYDKVYSADRPEIFFKSTAQRVVGPDEAVRVRYDSKWSVPEPEFTLVLNPQLEIVGYTIGNDMSARDIEGENPLYLPQAKVYRQCCALGPWIVLAEKPLDLPATKIDLRILRGGKVVVTGSTSLGEMHRKLPELADWLGREDEFPMGAFLLTGTGIIPHDDFSLEQGDVVEIEIAGIGTLRNPVAKGTAACR